MEDRGFRVGGQEEEGGARGEGKQATSFSLAGGITPPWLRVSDGYLQIISTYMHIIMKERNCK